MKREASNDSRQFPLNNINIEVYTIANIINSISSNDNVAQLSKIGV
jgi:hypothetical protein